METIYDKDLYTIHNFMVQMQYINRCIVTGVTFAHTVKSVLF